MCQSILLALMNFVPNSDEEEIAIVNDGDKVIGTALRSEAHAKGHIHRSVLFFVFDQESRIFVNQRTENKEFYPGYWSIVFGGHVHAGETYEEAVEREAKEEAGITAKPVFMTAFKKRYDKKDRENVRVYAFITDGKLTVDPSEIARGEFMTMGELEQKLGTEKFLPETERLYNILEDYL
jgi:isopentenyl-diphosphate Delta-isomerase